jgi:hypothetical protein
MSKFIPPLPRAQAKLHERAKKAEAAWFAKLPKKERAKLKTQASQWGRNGGNLIAPKPRHGKTFHKREKLRRKREALLRAEEAAYEARHAYQAPTKD